MKFIKNLISKDERKIFDVTIKPYFIYSGINLIFMFLSSKGNDYGREFGKLFPENTYNTDVQISWKEDKTDYNIYANNDNLAYDVSVPIHFCPMCGRKFD